MIVFMQMLAICSTQTISSSQFAALSTVLHELECAVNCPVNQFVESTVCTAFLGLAGPPLKCNSNGDVLDLIL